MTGNKWGLLTVVMALVAIGFAAMSTNQHFSVPHWVPKVFFATAGLVTLWLVTLLIKNKQPERRERTTTTRFDGIISVLQQMDEHLRKLARKEALKPVNWSEYDKINSQMNKDILGLVPGNFKTLKGAKKIVSKIESAAQEQVEGKIKTINDAVSTLEKPSNYLDSKGFGLKQIRETDDKYLRLSKSLDKYRTLPIGTKINSLVRLHIASSQYSANLLLAIHRGLNAKTVVQGQTISLSDLISPEMQSNLEAMEANFKEITSEIRARIGDCIRELEASKSKNEPELPSIVVEPITDSVTYYLEVKNVGTAGTFEAEVKVIAGRFPTYRPFSYKGCWEQNPGKETRILNGQTDKLRIARLVTLEAGGIINPPMKLELCYWDSKTNQEQHESSYAWIPGARNVTTDGTEMPVEKPEFTISVNISTVEGMKEGSFIRHYKLTLAGLEELPTAI
jgi:hypothetical protein